MGTVISLSLLEYEADLLKQLDQIERSMVFSKIIELVDSGKLYSLHIDVMRPPLIPHRSSFPIQLIGRMYDSLHEKIILEIHLMVKDPYTLIQEMNRFIEPRERGKIPMIIQREAYSMEEDAVKTLREIRSLGYKAGIGLNLPTSFGSLTDEMIKGADIVLIMSVPMGKGGQEYSDEATQRIKEISGRFPDKSIKVDGGINDKTVVSARNAGAKILVVGSFVTMSREPLDAVEKIERILKDSERLT